MHVNKHTPGNHTESLVNFNIHLYEDTEWQSSCRGDCKRSHGWARYWSGDLANSCFKNSVLQCFLYTPTLTNIISTCGSKLQHSKFSNSAGAKFRLLCTLTSLLVDCPKGGSTVASVSVHANLGVRLDIFVILYTEQQDYTIWIWIQFIVILPDWVSGKQEYVNEFC